MVFQVILTSSFQVISRYISFTSLDDRADPNSITNYKSLRQLSGGVLQISSDGDEQMGAKIKTQKNPLDFQQNQETSLDQKLTPKKSHAEFPSLQISRKHSMIWHEKWSFQKQVWSYFIRRSMPPRYARTYTNLQMVLNTPTNPYLSQAIKKILAKISYPKKNAESKISNPKKPFDHPCRLKSWVPPRPFPRSWAVYMSKPRDGKRASRIKGILNEDVGALTDAAENHKRKKQKTQNTERF